MHRIVCKDTGNGCDAFFDGENDDLLVGKVVEHMAQDHGVPLTPELAARVRTLIRPVYFTEKT